MRNLLALIGAAVVAFVVVGWMLGWYKIKTATGPQGHPQVNIDFDGSKIKEDLSRGRERLASFLEQPSSQSTQPTPSAAPTTTNPPLPPGGESVTVRPSAPGGQVRGGMYWFVPQN